MRFATAAIAFRTRGDMAFGVPVLRPPCLAWPILKLARCATRTRAAGEWIGRHFFTEKTPTR